MSQNSYDFMQQSYRNAFAALAGLIGSKTILTGVVVNTNNNTVSDGWISYNGELMPFRGGGLAPGVVVQETGQALSFQDGNSRTVKFTKYAQCGAPPTFSFYDLKAPQSLRDGWCTGDVKEIDCTLDYIIANFDLATGLGLNERTGWALCDGRNDTKDRRGRGPIGWDDRTVDPLNGIWDAIYHNIGSVGGEKAHQLSLDQMPAHSHQLVQPNGQPYYGDTGGGGGQFSLKGDNDNSVANGTLKTDVQGGGQPHENRQPFIVTLFIQKL